MSKSTYWALGLLGLTLAIAGGWGIACVVATLGSFFAWQHRAFV